MVRARSGSTILRKRARQRKLTKGFRLGRHNLYRQAHCTLIRSRAFAYRHRKTRKREFRKLWIIRINAAARLRGLRYSELIHGLQLAMVMLDRKSLSQLAISDPAVFDKVVEVAKQALAAKINATANVSATAKASPAAK